MSVDVLFGQAYFLRFDPKQWDAQQPYAPLGALYAAAVVRDRCYSVALFDAMLAESEAEWTTALSAHRPRVAVIYEDSFNYLSKMCLSRMRDAALTMVAAAKAHGARVIVAGSDASDHPGLYLDRGAELVICGEGEATLTEVLDALERESGLPLEAIDGIAFRGSDGQILKTRPRGMMRDLDDLPFPAWDLVDVERYRAIWRNRHGYFSMNVATTRGCPYHCNWCAKPIYGQRYIARSPQTVVDEIEWLKREYRPDHLWIADDIFGLKPGWIEEFARLVVERRAAVPFKCLLRADGVTPSIVAALRAAGCRTVWVGAESGSQRVLDAMEKGTTVEQIIDARARLGAAGIEVGFFLQFGYPGETFDDIQLTLRMVRVSRPDDIGVSVSYPLPGTPFYERVKAELGDKQNWVDSNDLALMYRGTYRPEFYRALHALVHAQFRGRRALEALRHAVRAPFAVGARDARQIAGGAVQAVRLPLLWRRVHALAQR
jgi:anaerobic magnesium-protoporphyrin IX monomethyl ester cyclase